MLPPSDRFCNPFDAALATAGPAAVFLRDRNGEWRFDAEWTRDAWDRAPHVGPNHASAAHGGRAFYGHAVDRDTGYAVLLLATSDTLLDNHPRMIVRWFEGLDAAEAALQALGRPPVIRSEAS